MKNIVIYTGLNCTHCHNAKEFFEKNNIPYIEYSTEDKEVRKFLVKKRVLSVPFIMIDDQEFIGFNQEDISKALEI